MADGPDGPEYCEICEMWLNGPTQMEDHKNGKKHKKNSRKGKGCGSSTNTKIHGDPPPPLQHPEPPAAAYYDGDGTVIVSHKLGERLQGQAQTITLKIEITLNR